MKRRTIFFAAACAGALALGGCMGDGYTTTSIGIGWHSYPYDVWYDGYYGPFYDGYWGTDGFFYYRLLQNDRAWHRADRDHFRRQPPPNTDRYRDRYRQYRGQSHQPPPNVRPPNYPGWGTGANRNRDRDRDRDRNRDRDRDYR